MDEYDSRFVKVIIGNCLEKDGYFKLQVSFNEERLSSLDITDATGASVP